MAKERALADVKTRFKVDYSELTKAEKAVAQAHGQFQSGATKSAAAAKALEGRIASVGGVLNKLGPIGQQAARSLDTVSQSATGFGGAIGLAGGIAVGAASAIAGGALYAVHAYASLVEQIDNYQDVTNTSAEVASRQVHLFQVLGVSQDVAAASMFKLSRAVAENADKLEALGIHVVTNEKGEADLAETLYAVADAYDATSDSSKRTAILFAAFGKGGAAMIDVVEQGSAKLRELAASARLVVSQDDIDRMRDYQIQIAEAKSSWDEFVASVGQKVLPVLAGLQREIDRNQYVQEQLNQAVKEGKITEGDLADARIHSNETSNKGTVEALKLTAAYSAQFDSMKDAEHEAAVLTATMKEVADAQHQVAKETDDAVNALQAQASAQIAADRANIALTTSYDKMSAAANAYNAYVKAHGRDTAEARSLLADYNNAVLDQEDAYLRAAAAAGKLARANHANADEQTAAKASVDATIAQFEAEARTLAPGSPLRKQLEGYIAELKKIPVVLGTTISLRFQGITSQGQGGTAVHGNVSFGGGGRPPVGRDVIVGEYGPEVARFDQPAKIYPHGSEPSGGGLGNINITINAQTNADANDIASEVGWTVMKLLKA